MIELTGVGPMTKVSIENATKDLEMIDAISLPLATLIFSLLLQTWRFFPIPFITMGVAASLSFGVMYFVSLGVTVFTTAPNLMMCILVAMSFDYSLFLLVRFQEELRLNKTVQDAIECSLCTSGFTITISGWTMIICFLSLTVFPIDIVASLGMGAAAGLLSVWIVNLTLFPALIMFAPEFF
eukprot:UN33788